MTGPEDIGDVDDAIAAELAALGETSVDDDELRFHRAGAEPNADADVASVATLMAIGTTEPDRRPLAEIEHRRAWNKVADRLSAAGHEVVAKVAGKSVWRSVLAGVAMAAGVALVPRLLPGDRAPVSSSASDHAALEAVGQSVRARLDAIDGEFDGARADDLAAAYAERLREGGR